MPAGLRCLAAFALLWTVAACESTPRAPEAVAPPPVAEPAEETADAEAMPREDLAALQAEDPFMLEEPARRVADERPGARVALLAPLSGRHAGVGRGLLEAAELALFDRRNPHLTLMPLDTAGTPQGAAEAARTAVERGADLIVGPLLAGSVDAVRPIAEAAGISVLAFTNTASMAGEGVHVLGFAPDQQVEEIVAFAADQGIDRFAVIAPRNPYGQSVVGALQRSVSRHGGRITRTAFIDPDATDFADQVVSVSDYQARRRALSEMRASLRRQGDEASLAALRRLADRDTLGDPAFDAILLPATSEVMLKTLAAQLAYYDVDQPAVRVLGLQLWDQFPGIDREPSLYGAWFVAPPEDARRQFDARFESIHGRQPMRLSWLAYDATALAALLAQEGGERQYPEVALLNPQGFAGVEGLFRLHRNGVAERAFEIREITRNGIRTIRPAPTRFDPLIN